MTWNLTQTESRSIVVTDTDGKNVTYNARCEKPIIDVTYANVGRDKVNINVTYPGAYVVTRHDGLNIEKQTLDVKLVPPVPEPAPEPLPAATLQADTPTRKPRKKKESVKS